MILIFRTLFTKSERTVYRRLALFGVLAALLLAASPSDRAAAETPGDPPSKLERQVQEWVSALSKQKPFADWQNADPQIEALGPGTHAWLVLFSKEGKNIGYMVVNAVTDGSFQLDEYGLGAYPLFSLERMRQSLVEGGYLDSDQESPVTAVKHYIHPFAAVWEVGIGKATYWLDAKTAETLPANDMAEAETLLSNVHTLPAGMPAPSGKASALRLNDRFDAYERLPWLAKEAPFPAEDASKLRSRLNRSGQLRYVSEPFGDDTMLYALPVVGYLLWHNGRTDLALDMEGLRFIPLDALKAIGTFYR